jgi:hypothetical protein
MAKINIKIPPHNLKLEIFRERCEARADLWVGNKLSLHDAVDPLAELAEAWDIDTDLAQHLMAVAFESRRIRL